jgi:hypothetical protein
MSNEKMNKEEIKLQLKKIQDHLDNDIKITTEFFALIKSDLSKGILRYESIEIEKQELELLGGVGSKAHKELIDMYMNYLNAYGLKCDSLTKDIKRIENERQQFVKKTVNNSDELKNIAKSLSILTNVDYNKILQGRMSGKEQKKVYKMWKESLKRSENLPEEQVQ